MIDFNSGIDIAKGLVQQSLEGSIEPFLTSSRLESDLQQLKYLLAVDIAKLSPDELVTLFPIALFLSSYEIAGENTFAGHHFWEIRFSDTGDIQQVGIGALVEHVNDVQSYQKVMSKHHYVFGVFYLLDKQDFSKESLPYRVSLMRRDDLASILMALVITEYIETFSLSISSIPGFRKKLYAALVISGISSERITAISKRWATLIKTQQIS